MRFIDRIFPSINTEPFVERVSEDERFLRFDDGVILDTKTGLEWMVAQGGRGFNNYDVVKWVETVLSTDEDQWRLPLISELQGIREERKGRKGKKNIDEIFGITKPFLWVWSDEDDKDCIKSRYLNFNFGDIISANRDMWSTHFSAFSVRVKR